MEVFGFSLLSLIFLGIGLYIGGAVYIGVKRVYFSPLSHIPGPRLAIATSWYECYYDVWKQGLYYKKVKEFHQKYGKTLASEFPHRKSNISDSRSDNSHQPI